MFVRKQLVGVKVNLLTVLGDKLALDAGVMQQLRSLQYISTDMQCVLASCTCSRIYGILIVEPSHPILLHTPAGPIEFDILTKIRVEATI